LIRSQPSIKLQAVPASAQHLTCGDIQVAVREHGEGELVVLAHGLAQDHGSWALTQQELGGWRTVAYDLRGHGETTLGEADGTLEQLGADLICLLEQLGPAVVVGFSLGGTVALWAAAQRPDLVRGLVVIGSSSVVGRGAAEFYEQRIELVRAGDRDAILAALRDDSAAAIATPGVDVDAIAAARLKAIGDGGGYCNASAAMARLREEPLTPRLADIECDVLVVGGEEDTFCPRRAADIMLAELPSATYAEVPGSGHLMEIDAPDAMTAEIRRFLAGRSGGDAPR
jgi:pimeloyl-ACP methyl ester carboxylesterase